MLLECVTLWELRLGEGNPFIGQISKSQVRNAKRQRFQPGETTSKIETLKVEIFFITINFV